MSILTQTGGSGEWFWFVVLAVYFFLGACWPRLFYFTFLFVGWGLLLAFINSNQKRKRAAQQRH